MKIKEKEEVLEEIEINNEEDELKSQKSKIAIIVLSCIIVILLIILYILCYRVGKIGYNYLSIWDQKNIPSIVITADNVKVDNKKQIDIFKNARVGDNCIIAPMSKGSFKFTIKNDTKEDVEYSIQFIDEMSNFVNMKYRLKMDNVYISGDKEKYIGINELDVKNLISPKDSTSIFVLEWFWDSDDEKDIYIGTADEIQFYSLTMHIYSQSYKKIN